MPNNPLDNYPPDVDFMPTEVAIIKDEMIATYERIFNEETGSSITVKPASEARIHLFAVAYMFYLAYQRIDHGMKMNLLKYSTDDFLENLAAWFGIVRNQNKPSYAVVEFELSQAQNNPVTVPAGTRVSTSNNVFFETTTQLTVPKGGKVGTVNIKSIEAGTVANGLDIGAINILVDPVPFVSKVRNITLTQGGADVETDSQLRTRIYNFPSSLSVAGPVDAYTYFALEFSQAIKSVKVIGPPDIPPGQVDIRVMLVDDILPEQAFLDELYKYLSEKDKRPLTDLLYVAAPDIANYAIDFTYYIGAHNQDQVKEIQQRVAVAVDDYIQWQDDEIGRDINPQVLTRNLINAGVKWADIRSPAFIKLAQTSIAKLEGTPAITYGGLEDD